MARPTKFSKDIIEKARHYADNYRELGDIVPTLSGLALYVGIGRKTLYEWRDEHVEFAHICDELMQRQERDLVNGGLGGEHVPTIGKLMLMKHGYSDKQEVEHSGTLRTQIVFDEELDE